MSESILEMEDGLQRANKRKMEDLRKNAQSPFLAWAIILGLVALWHTRIETIVPRPYLDEFFHVQQAELYLQGRYFEWHPKITTPPGLYLVSLFYLSCLSLVGLIDKVNIADLRRTNVLAAAFLPLIGRSVLRGVVTEYDGLQLLDRSLPVLWSLIELNHAVLNICLFPPLFFFFGLYYTDVLSSLSVLITIRQHQKRRMKSMVVAGVLSLFFRQTNILWVAVYLGGLEVVRRLRRGRLGVEYLPSPTWKSVLYGSWQHLCIYDPLVATASFEDYVKTVLSIATACAGGFKKLLHHLMPYIILLSVFGYFVLWNGGVVLGDKENHVPSLHLAQMLYIWPYIMFFSFPMLYPYFLSAVVPQEYFPAAFRTGSTRHQLPRLIVTLPIMAIMLVVVHFNTIVHPFTLADNRHYTFYVFRILLRHPANKYLAVPIYFYSAWATITAFGGLPNVQTPSPRPRAPPPRPRGGNIAVRPESPRRSNPRPRLPPPSMASVYDRGHHIGKVLIWLLASTLSLVTAPLVEPRYFIVPWLIWRFHVASPWPTGDEAYKKRKKRIRTFKAWYKAVLYARHDHRLWLETVWFLAVNWGVCYVFLHWGFEWPQEKEKVQRFMW